MKDYLSEWNKLIIVLAIVWTATERAIIEANSAVMFSMKAFALEVAGSVVLYNLFFKYLNVFWKSQKYR